MPPRKKPAEQPQLLQDAEPVDVASIEVLDPAKPIVAFNPIRAAIADLTKRYGKVMFEVTTPKGLDDAKAARLAIREPRYKIEHIRKALKAPVLDLGRRIDAEAEDYTSQLTALETPIDQQIKDREVAIEQEKIAKAASEAAERRRIDQAIADLQFYAVEAAGKDIEQTRKLLAELAGLPLTQEIYCERLPEAVLARNATIKRLEGMIEAALAAAEQARKLAEEEERQRLAREDIARQQEELKQRLAALAAAAPPAEAVEPGASKAQDDSDPFGQAAATHGVPVEMLRQVSQQESAAAGGAPTGHFRYVDRTAQPAALVEVAAATGEVQHLGDIDDSSPFAEPLSALAATDDAPEAPTLADLVAVIADDYGVDDATAEAWLRSAIAEADAQAA